MEVHHGRRRKSEGLRKLFDFADTCSLTAPRAPRCRIGRRQQAPQRWVPLPGQSLREIQGIYEDFGRRQNVELVVHGGGHGNRRPVTDVGFRETSPIVGIRLRRRKSVGNSEQRTLYDDAR